MKVKLIRYLRHDDIATKSIELPCIFPGLIIGKAGSQWINGKIAGTFIVDRVEFYNGEYTAYEGGHVDSDLAPQLNSKPTEEWVAQEKVAKEKNRDEVIQICETYGWAVKRSSTPVKVSYFY